MAMMKLIVAAQILNLSFPLSDYECESGSIVFSLNCTMQGVYTAFGKNMFDVDAE